MVRLTRQEQAEQDKNDLSRFTPRQLMEELWRRGYDGELTFVQKTKLSKLFGKH